MKLLLIGNGYLGHEIARVFRDHSWQVTTASLSGTDDSLPCDVGDADSVKQLPAADFIIHCASSGKGGPDAYRHVHVEGCRNLTERFPGTPLLFTSSSSVYAQVDGSVVTEESPTEPDRETGKLLLEAETIVLRAGGIAARLAGIYGPGRSVILRKFLAGETVIEEDGGRFLNQIYRDDAARAIHHLVTSGNVPRGQVYNVADNTPLTQLECHRALAEMFGKELPPSGPRDLNRKRGWTHKRVSNAKLRATDWQPLYGSFLDAAAEIARAGG